jgi:nucleotide-binding universal stress UspA family protein
MERDGMIAKILVPTDFSAGSTKAWRTALGLADTLRAEVILLHVLPATPFEIETIWREEEAFAALRALQAMHQLGIPRPDEPPPHPSVFHGPLTGDVIKDFSEAGRAWASTLEAWADAARDGGVAKVRTLLRVGVPYREVIETVKDEHIDLVVMATHGWGDIHRWLVGSVADKVIRMAPCAVMTVREAA